ncbi:Uu.00g074580.m01.CDS01 [Anthostomella pinea]|uniref:Uu.00g074580.m01.CDS01 n=1 Tax=Anthostomella pinea TaxID=933095 RepID=A0AAI8VWP7_9PEZI|nr:Uu.00g074580.m01.CDS01 [Anthostomella pinea]
MAKEKKKAPATTHGVQAHLRRQKVERARLYQDRVWRNLNPLKAAPKLKHKTYFESVENADKKKKLEFEITTDRRPPPGFEFIPTGHPELSQACKERSRELDAMFFIVSASKDPGMLDHHMNRAGYHFRQSIVDAAREVLKEEGHHDHAARTRRPGDPEPIPLRQEDINREADAVLRDLFPRIPNTDRHEIIEHAFNKDTKFHGEVKVGMATDIPLARRVQLAALAHIRHTHTRYDQLLKEADWANARKAVEKPCLDIIVKWRGDEETGRDQLEEILREVVEISDSEGESEDESSGPEDGRVPNARAVVDNQVAPQNNFMPNQQPAANGQSNGSIFVGPLTPPRQRVVTKADKRIARKTQQRFRRYAAAAEAFGSQPQQNDQFDHGPAPMNLSRSNGPVYLVSSDREPTITVQHTPNAGHIQGRMEARGEPCHFSNGYHGRMTGAMPYDPPDSHMRDASPRIIRRMESERPKVGQHLSNHSRSHIPLSPVRTGLQDLLVPSIEPTSPAHTQGSQRAPQVLYRESRQFAEVPRVISRTMVEPGVSAPLLRSPGAMMDVDENDAKRRRVIPYHDGPVAHPSSSYVRVNREGQIEDHRRAAFEYLSDRPLAPSRAAERVMPDNNSWALPREEVQLYSREVGPPRTRANPIFLDGDDDHRPRHVVEMRGPPQEPYSARGFLPPRGELLHNAPAQGDPRSRDASRVIYVDEPSPMSRVVSDARQNGVHQGSFGQALHHEPLVLHLAPETPHRRLDVPPGYPPGHYREIIRGQEPERAPMEWTGNTPREVHTVRREPERYEMRYETSRGAPMHPHLAPVAHPQPKPHLEQRDGHFYGPVQVAGPEMDYRRDHQRPFPVFPPASAYEAPRVPHPGQHLPERREVIYVD